MIRTALAVALLAGALRAARADSAIPLPHYAVNCADWTHTADGTWHADDRASVRYPRDPGSFADETLYPAAGRFYLNGGFDLFAFVDQRCGGRIAPYRRR